MILSRCRIWKSKEPEDRRRRCSNAGQLAFLKKGEPVDHRRLSTFVADSFQQQHHVPEPIPVKSTTWTPPLLARTLKISRAQIHRAILLRNPRWSNNVR